MKVHSTEKLLEVRDDILEELYKRSYPSVDSLEQVKEKDEEFEQPVYNLHYMDNKKMEEIAKHIMRYYGLSKHEKKRVKGSVFLGSAPNGNLEKVNEYREKEGLEKVSPDE